MSRLLRAFTLVELLIVIAILTILAALLFPALQETKDMARAVCCQSNLKQKYLACQLYANDFKGQLPWANSAYQRIDGRRWAPGNNGFRFFPHFVESYMPLLSEAHLCPGQPLNTPYIAGNPAAPTNPAMVPGTPRDPNGPAVPATPRNMGDGFDYLAYAAANLELTHAFNNGTVPGNAVVESFHKGQANELAKWVNFRKARNPAIAVVFECMMPQGDWGGFWYQREGPHARQTKWHTLYANGRIRGLLRAPWVDALWVPEIHRRWCNQYSDGAGWQKPSYEGGGYWNH